MKFLIDAGVGKKVEEVLKMKGHDVKSILNINPTSTDLSILELAINRTQKIAATVSFYIFQNLLQGICKSPNLFKSIIKWHRS